MLALNTMFTLIINEHNRTKINRMIEKMTNSHIPRRRSPTSIEKLDRNCSYCFSNISFFRIFLVEIEFQAVSELEHKIVTNGSLVE